MRNVILFLIVFVNWYLYSQTVPSAQSLPYSQDFSSLPWNSSTYPDGWNGWTLGGNPSGETSTAFKVSAPIADSSLNPSGDANKTAGRIWNYNGKLGFLPTGQFNPALVLAINTFGFRRVIIRYDIMTIRNPYDGTNNTRINKVALQYRAASDTGSYTTTSDSSYENNTTTQTGNTTDPQKLETHIVMLPSDCDNKSVVQLRWVTRQVSGKGDRPSFAVDNIYINGTRFFTESGAIGGGYFYGLELDGSNISLNLNGDLTVDTLIFTQNGKVITGEKILKVNSQITGAGPGKFIEGNLVYPVSSTGSKKWETGQGSDYLPVTIDFTDLVGSGDVTVSVIDSVTQRPDGPLGNNKVLRRWFRIQQSGISSFQANITFSYSDADLARQGITDENSLRVFKWDGTQWIELNVIARDVDNNTITVSGVSSFSDFVISGTGDAPLPVQVVNVSAEVVGNVVKLRIKTQVEREDFLGFNIYRGRGDENYILVGSYQSEASLRAKGNGAFGSDYEFVDKGVVESGKYYYRIEAVSRYERKDIDVIQVVVDVPKKYALYQNYPNPFNPYTTIKFELPVASSVRLELYNSAGQKVKDLFVGELPAGYHEVRVDGRDLSSGVYFYVLRANDFVGIKKMVLVK
ncbi:Por secretion system C-terminal sorting domain-containing protein [Candidatus Kryptobacter tengchongensis]|nr:Por secretion system C-terminal sorting domain-containing protein [Candidatus Kryptobacter tengchongensis]